MILQFLNENLDKVEKPSRYIGGELNQVVKDPSQVKIRVGLIFPDLYEVGMSNLGLLIIYHVLNNLPQVWAERVFLPWKDMMKLMKQRKIELFTLESKTPLKELDLIGISLQYELSYTNVLCALDLAGIPIYSHQRTDDDPLVIAGGPCATNPEVLAEVFDAFVIGDGEEVILEIAGSLMETKGMKREQRLRALSQIEGIYVPIFYQPTIPPKPISDWAPKKIKRRITRDLNNVTLPDQRIIPNSQLIHDRIVIEVMRGCTRGCRFCQAGIIYRPVREKYSENILDESISSLLCTGYEELALLSLSTADHSTIDTILQNLREKTMSLGVSLSIPSTRLDSFGLSIAEAVSTIRRTGLTFAPEAGTQRLRNVINKNVTEEDYINTLEAAKRAGWNRVKLYFMVGLPTETDEDLLGIVQMARVARKVGFKKIVLSVANFIPKAHTPFQFCKQRSTDYLTHAQKIILQAKDIANINFHDPYMSLIEGLLSRGDRKVFEAVLKAFKSGSLFDNWENVFNFNLWKDAIEKSQIDLSCYLGERKIDEDLPWDHIDVGVSKNFLIQEYHRAVQAITTSDCRWNQCHGCGVCNSDLKNLLERVSR
ncbi:MAG: TIGR03960 family B12-binding radical SAM protein [Pseudothermotoga sp.]